MKPWVRKFTQILFESVRFLLVPIFKTSWRSKVDPSRHKYHDACMMLNSGCTRVSKTEKVRKFTTAYRTRSLPKEGRLPMTPRAHSVRVKHSPNGLENVTSSPSILLASKHNITRSKPWSACPFLDMWVVELFFLSHGYVPELTHCRFRVQIQTPSFGSVCFFFLLF